VGRVGGFVDGDAVVLCFVRVGCYFDLLLGTRRGMQRAVSAVVVLVVREESEVRLVSRRLGLEEESAGEG